jgi:hypothetical protein
MEHRRKVRWHEGDRLQVVDPNRRAIIFNIIKAELGFVLIDCLCRERHGFFDHREDHELAKALGWSCDSIGWQLSLCTFKKLEKQNRLIKNYVTVLM